MHGPVRQQTPDRCPEQRMNAWYFMADARCPEPSLLPMRFAHAARAGSHRERNKK